MPLHRVPFKTTLCGRRRSKLKIRKLSLYSASRCTVVTLTAVTDARIHLHVSQTSALCSSLAALGHDFCMLSTIVGHMIAPTHQRLIISTVSVAWHAGCQLPAGQRALMFCSSRDLLARKVASPFRGR